MFLYDDKSDKDNIYQYQITDTLPEYANTELIKRKFLVLTTEIDTLEYETLTYNDSIISLMYFPRGNIHVYRKKKNLHILTNRPCNLLKLVFSQRYFLFELNISHSIQRN